MANIIAENKLNKFIPGYDVIKLDKLYNYTIFATLDEAVSTIKSYLTNCAGYLIDIDKYVYKITDTEFIIKKKLPDISFRYYADKEIYDISLRELKTKVVNIFSTIVCTPHNTDSYKFNIFSPIIAIPIENESIIQPILSFIKEIICCNNAQLYNYIMQWIKNICTYERNMTAIILYSEKHGTGKNIFINFLIQYVIGEHLSYIATTLVGVMNKYIDLSGKMLVNVNELSTTTDSYIYQFDILKSLIKNRTLNVNKIENKKFTQHQINNLTNWIFTIGDIDHLELSKYDRLFTCIEISDIRANDIKYFTELKKNFNQETGNAFLTYLLNTDFNSDTYTIFDTQLRQDMIILLPIDQFITDIQNEEYKLSRNKGNGNTGIQSSKLFKEFKIYCQSRNINYSHITYVKFNRNIRMFHNIQSRKNVCGIYYYI